MILVLVIIFSRLILSLTEEEDFTILACEQVLFLAFPFESKVNRQERICNKGMSAVESATFVIRVLPE